MYTEVEGFIISEVDFKETSKILNIFTKEYGIIGVTALGVKKLKSPLRSYAHKFTYGTFYIKYKENKLSSLINVDVINPFKNVRSNLTLISYLSYIVDLTSQTFKESGSKLIYDLFISSLLKLESGLDPVVLTNILELKYLKFLGVEPDLYSCSVCSSNNEIISINKNTSDLICDDCNKTGKLINPKIIKLLRMYENININSISNIKIDDELKVFINKYLKGYYENYTGLYLYSKNFIENNI